MKLEHTHLDHMEVRWKNFKGFKDTDWVKIKPITILLGSNNSGKTSFLAPLLLMSQTINSRDRDSPLILKGETFDGGNFQEIVKDYDTSKEIFFGFRYHIHETTDSQKLEKVGAFSPGSFEISFGQEKTSEELYLKQSSIYDIFKRPFLSLKRDTDEKFHYSGIGSKSFKRSERQAIKESSPTNFLFSPNTILGELEAKAESKGEEKLKRNVEQFSKGFSQFLSAISYNNSRARRYFGELSFIGPLREQPHRIYEITNETFNTVGVRGENMPHLLKKLGDKNEELNYWIKEFGFGDFLELKNHYSNTYSIRFRKYNDDHYTSIANAGFGASQVLPLIVQALVSPERSITVAEQPEIHLNPRIQCTLANLFVSMANKGQTVITETHSEHLLLRLRRLVAQKEIDANDVAIYFVEKEGHDSRIKEISLQKNGHINPIDWPKDFFAETLKESMALASEQTKKKAND